MVQMPCELALFTTCLPASLPRLENWGSGSQARPSKRYLAQGDPQLASAPWLVHALHPHWRSGDRPAGSALGLLKQALRKLTGELAQGPRTDGRWAGGSLQKRRERRHSSVPHPTQA